MKYHITELFNIEELRQLCESFTEINGTVTAILDLEGNVLIATGWQPICTQFHRINDETKKRCSESDTILAGKIKQGHKYNIYKCKNGLVDVAIPIMIENEHVGNFFTGQFFTEEPDKEYFIKQARKFGFDEKKYLVALENTPVFSEEQIRKNVSFLVKLTESIGKAGLKNLINIEQSKQLEIDKFELLEINEELAASEEEIRATNDELILAKEKAEDSEKAYKDVVETTSDLITVVDHHGEFIFVNHASLYFYGIPPEDCIGKFAFDFVHPDDIESTRNQFAKWLESAECNFYYENRLIQNKGKTLNLAWDIHIDRYENQIVKITSIARDITKQKEINQELIKAKEKAEENEANITAIIEGTNNSIWAFNRNYEILYINRTFQREFLQSFGVLLETGTNLIEVLPESLQPFWKPRYDKVLANEQFTLEDAVPTNNGTIYIEVSFNPIVKNGQVIGGSCFATNITSRKLAEIELEKAKEKAEESEKQLRHISDNFVNGMIYQVALLDENRRQFNYVSKNVEELYGCTAEEAKKDANLIYGKIHPDDIEGLIEKEKVALKKMSTFETEARTITPKGNIRWAYYISKPRIINGVVCWDGIEIDITERKQMELELINAKEKAEESDRLKSAFLTNMSHEIRTPMNGILGFTELLKEPNLSSEDQLSFIEVIQRSGDRMLNTINDIIDISKIESGLVKVNIQEVNINEQMEFKHNFFSLESERKGLQLSFKNGLPDKDAKIKTDNEKVDGILTNLIKNAIKFTNDGSIYFGYEKKGKYLEFFVKDTGVGIPKHNLQSIFDRFRQVDESNSRLNEGSGLGLSISKSFVEMLGGKMWLESEEGLGSTFYFTIPYVVESESDIKIMDIVSPESKDIQVKNLKILIVEDDEISHSLLSLTIDKISAEVLHARTGIEAIEVCKNNPDLDLVLMDVRMPEMNGLEATHQIRQFNKELVIIAQTAYGFESDSKKALEAGCNDYISKPIKMTLLNELINKHCNR